MPPPRRRVGVREPRDRVGPDVPKRIPEESEDGRDERQLEPDEHAPAPEERRKPARHAASLGGGAYEAEMISFARRAILVA